MVAWLVYVDQPAAADRADIYMWPLRWSLRGFVLVLGVCSIDGNGWYCYISYGLWRVVCSYVVYVYVGRSIIQRKRSTAFFNSVLALSELDVLGRPRWSSGFSSGDPPRSSIKFHLGLLLAAIRRRGDSFIPEKAPLSALDLSRSS